MFNSQARLSTSFAVDIYQCTQENHHLLIWHLQHRGGLINTYSELEAIHSSFLGLIQLMNKKLTNDATLIFAVLAHDKEELDEKNLQ